MKAKLLSILIVVLIALLSTSYAYACLTIDKASINCLIPNLVFNSATASENENLATIKASISSARDTITVTVYNAYPNYQGTLKYSIKNTGNTPIQFTGLTIINSNPNALLITPTNPTGILIQPSQITQGTTGIKVLPNAEENHVYTFKIQISAQAKEPAKPHTVDFWRDRFQEQLCKGNQPKIDASTLEQYLNQISSQSNIFKFTGTRQQKFQQAQNILTLPKKANAEPQLKAQLLGLWLNQIAGWTTGYKLEGKTSQQIIQGSEGVLRNKQTSKYDSWRSLCERFNNLG